MTTVYVVTSGSYSDGRIEAVFSTEAAAQRYVALADVWDEFRVQPYDLDQSLPDRPRYWYSATSLGHIDLELADPLVESRDEYLQISDSLLSFTAYPHVSVTGAIDADDLAHALEIIPERLAPVFSGQKAIPAYRNNDPCGTALYDPEQKGWRISEETGSE